MNRVAAAIAMAAKVVVLLTLTTGAIAADGPASPGFTVPARWKLSAPLVAPEKRDHDPCVSVKDPSVVYSGGKWHLFMTIRCEGYTPLEYAAFDDWARADAAPRHMLKVREKYFAAPQVFYFRPQKKWYLIYQVTEPDRRLKHHVGYSTTADIADPESWSKTALMFADDDPRIEAGLDFWIICDQQRAWLFYTNLKGTMWRLWTSLQDFPRGFHDPQVALKADIFEASHTYRLKGLDKYLGIIESGQSGRRFYKAYLADRLDGAWLPLADREQQPFAGAANVAASEGVEPWTDNISHGELLRDGCDETMTVDPARLRFVIQGVLQKDKPRQYGKIPWRIGMLTPAD